MELASKYNPADIESKWYQYWLEKGFFKSKPDNREPYTIVIPPPNVTGVLHMGHMLNNTIQDVLVRRARMKGKNACWVPGTDHASIATEAKVVGKLAAEGIKKTDLTREQFLEHAWDWTHKHGGIILEQLKKLGASCDWDRTAFTMDEPRSESVIKVFIDLYKKGLIYRGVRMVNWDPKALTALSDEEVIYKEVSGKLYYLRYKIEGEDGYAVVATTRPETIMGDTAMCINPNDHKNAHLKGKKVLVPLINRTIPVIEDEYVDIEFGTGCLKVTPAHDVNDYVLGEKYNLPSIDIFNADGTLNEHGEMYANMDRFEVRTKIEKDLEAAGLIEKIEPYTNKVGFSERTDVVIEPKLSMQWFLKMEKLAQPALQAVMNDEIKLHPAKFKNTYRHWMENVKDWCISRQLWWGHRIPAWFLPQGGFVVAATREEALEKAKQIVNYTICTDDLRQDEDCLDTWFSSWLWPISVFDGINNPDNEDIRYYYPTDDLVTAPEILFFWVARMIIAGYEYEGNLPFKNVYLTGIVRDKLGRKMSKSLGNSPDPLDLIAHYGADAVRLGMLFTSPAGNDLPYDDSLCEQGRNFNNKIWNAFRLVKGWEVKEMPQPEAAAVAIKWFDSQLSKTLAEIDDLFSKYRLSEALMAVYKLFWDDFSSWYLEMIKPAYQQPIDKATYYATLGFFDVLLKILHPFMPFITEELWQALQDRKEGESIMVTLQPDPQPANELLITQFEKVKEIIAGVRTIRLQKNVPNKEQISLQISGEHESDFDAVILKLCNLTAIEVVAEKSSGSISFLVGTTEYAVPMGNLINAEEEIQKMEAEITYLEGFLVSVMKKLGNDKFVANAKPEVVEAERKKQADAESKIASLKEAIAGLK
ncbi:MAG: valine--tRNA ligase [Paludibacter sp.]|nr:valine--tRNA ligase [Paludibacter sp.]MDD4198120.1 valine--tRNA ligase [Paludibacter sp.]